MVCRSSSARRPCWCWKELEAAARSPSASVHTVAASVANPAAFASPFTPSNGGGVAILTPPADVIEHSSESIASGDSCCYCCCCYSRLVQLAFPFFPYSTTPSPTPSKGWSLIESLIRLLLKMLLLIFLAFPTQSWCDPDGLRYGLAP